MTNEYNNYIDQQQQQHTSPSSTDIADLASSSTTTMTSNINNNNNSTATSSTATSSSSSSSNNNNNDVNMEYDQIKYNFLKLLKQFKIFEFDKFMKWLEKLVYDYQRIGYNVIENLENEFITFSNNKSLQHKPFEPLTFVVQNNRQQLAQNGSVSHHLNGNGALLQKIQPKLTATTTTTTNTATTSSSISSASSSSSSGGVKDEPVDSLNDHHTNINGSQQQQQQQHLTAVVSAAANQNNKNLLLGAAAAHAAAAAAAAALSPSQFYTHASLLHTTSGRLFKSKINEQQINALETVFKQKQYLNQFEKEQLSNLLNITPLQVKSWFKNRRYRQKKLEQQQQQLHSQQKQQQQQKMNNTNGTVGGGHDSTNDDDDCDAEEDEEEDCDDDEEYHDDTTNLQNADDSVVVGVGDDIDEDQDDDCGGDEDNTMNSDSNENDLIMNTDHDGSGGSSGIGAGLHHIPNYNYHQPKQSPVKSSPSGAVSVSPPNTPPMIKNNSSSSTSLLAAAALAAVTTNVPINGVAGGGVQAGSPFLYHPTTYQLNTIKFSKALNDELEHVFEKQKYISNTQRDYLAEKFHVASTQITNWFQNKRRKLKRLERNQNLNRIKSENAAQLAYNAISEQLRTQQQQQASGLLNTSNNRILIKNSPILNRSQI